MVAKKESVEIKEEVKAKPVEAPKDGLVSVDLGDVEIQLGNVVYRGKMRVVPAVADQLMSMKPFVKSQQILVKDLFSKK